MRYLPLSAAALVLLLAQCRRADPAPAPPVDPLTLLPAETQTGAYTFGCLVNGKAYANTTTAGVSGDWQNPNTLFIGASARENGLFGGDEASLGILLNGKLQGNQKFVLVPFNKPINKATNEIVVGTHLFTTGCDYDGNYIKTGQLTLTKFDGVARIASGRFAFILYRPGGCDTLRVTDGRFDVKF